MLLIGEDLVLPDQAVTEKIGVFGISGSGKTNTAGVLVEAMVGAGQHVVVCDPLGVCWGLLSSADGEQAGLPLVVFGGKHAHIPLQHEQGTQIADVILSERLSAILDLSDFDRTEMTLFMADLIRYLLRTNREPLHIVFDEAQLFAPQQPDKQQQALISGMERLTLTGRVRGLGMTFVSQRPTLVSKNVVSQMGLLIAHKISHVADQKTLLDWARPKLGSSPDLVDMAASLARQPKGRAWVVGEVDEKHIAQQAQIRLRTTFDSSATPRVGEQVRTPQTLATVDLTSLQQRLAHNAEVAAQDDPETLRRQIARLQEQLRIQKPERVEVPVVRPEDIARLEAVCDSVIAMGKDQVAQGQELLALGRGIQSVLRSFDHGHASTEADVDATTEVPPPAIESPPAEIESRAGATLEQPAQAPTPPAPLTPLIPEHSPARPPAPVSGPIIRNLPTGARHLVETLARAYPGKVTRRQWATLANRSATGGAFSDSYRALASAGLIFETQGYVALTPAGCAAFGLDPNPAPKTLAETVALWTGALKPREREILLMLIDAAPACLPRTTIAERIGMEASGGAFNGYLQSLRQNGLIIMTGPQARASADLCNMKAREQKR